MKSIITRGRSALLVRSVAVAVASIGMRTYAATESYSGPNGGAYNVAGSWSPDNMVPDSSGFDAIINQTSGVTVLLTADATVNSLTLGVGNILTFQNNTHYTITGGTLSNNGLINLVTGGNNADLVFAGNAIITGVGTITMSDSTNNNTNARILNNNSGVLTIGSGQLIEGAGQIGAGNTSFINNGTITATLSAGLFIQSNSGGFVNNGLLLATGGNTLFLRDSGITNNSIIEAADASFVRLDTNTVVSGGTLTTTGSGEIITTGGNGVSLDNVTISAGSNYLLENNTTTTVGGTLTNNGTFTFATAGNLGTINLNGAPVEFAGTGTFVLNRSDTAQIAGNGTLSIDSGITIMGAGQLISIAVVNHGLLLANSTAGALSFSPTAGGLVNTGGVIRATNGATANFNGGTYTNSGGTITADIGSAVRFNNGAIVIGGILSSTGTGTLFTTGGDDVTLNNVTITAGSNYVVENNTATTVTGKLTNNGTFTFATGGNVASINLNALPVEFAGTGTFILNRSDTAQINGNGTLSIDSGITIMGAGQLTSIAVVNQGLILANSTNGSFTITPSAGGLVNTGGIIRATNGATASLNAGAYTNTGGTITADIGSAVRFNNGAAITGGILSGIGTGTFFSTTGDSVTLNNVTISTGTNYVVENNSTTIVSGTLTNNGTFTFAAGGNVSDIDLNDQAVEFAGTGSYILNRSDTAQINGNGTLTIDPGITIEGAGQLTSIAINNQGLILANSTNGSLAISPTGAGLNNAGGRVEASAGNTINMTGVITNTAGTLTADTGSLIIFGQGANVIGGVLTTVGSGSLSSALSAAVTLNNVTLSLGSNYYLENNSTTFISGGTLTNNGTFTFHAGGNNTNIDLDGAVVEFAGTGTYVLNRSDDALIDGGGTLTIDPTITIEGAGQLTGIAINNQGLILANSTNGSLIITPNGAGLNNAGGRVEASAGNTINMSGMITNTAGTLTADTNSVISLGEGATVIGGVLTTTGSGSITSAQGISVTLNDVTIPAGSNYYVGNNSTTTIAGGTLTNNGTFTFQAGGNITNDSLGGQAIEFAGSGTFILNRNDNAQINGGGTLTIDPAITVEGAGQLNGIAIVNKGLILGNNSTSGMTITPTAGGMINTGGIVRATAGSTVTLIGALYTNTGGTLTADTGSSIRLNNSVTVTGGVFSSTGTGEIAIAGGSTDTLSNITIAPGSHVDEENNSELFLSGVITNNGLVTLSAGGNITEVAISGNTEFAGSGSFTFGNNSNNVLLGDNSILTIDSGVTIQGGGTFGDGSVSIVNAGTIIANDPTNFLITPNATGFSNTGTVIATNGATMNVTGLLQDTTGTLTAGTYIVNENSHLNLNGSPNITLIGAAATVILNGTASSMPTIDNLVTGTVTENDGHFELLGNRSYTVASAFTNVGTLQLGGGVFTATALTNNSTGTIIGFGTIAERPLNHGTIEASGGTLTIVNGINGGSGTIQSDPGSTVDLSVGTSNSSADFLVNNGSLTLGANSVLVAQGYTNADFGSGNSFNKHAGVTTVTGKILAEGTNIQTVTGGNITAGTSTTPLLALGNIHVGATANFTYQVNNLAGGSASGPAVLFVIQNATDGGNITDARLTGTGVTAQNLLPVALGGSTTGLGLTFSGLTAGSLTAQSIHIANNFDGNSVASSGAGALVEQTISITGGVYRYAAPALQGSPLNLGTFHVGDTVPVGHFTLSNTAVADNFSEGLIGTASGATGAITIAGSVPLLAAGGTDSAHLTATLASTATAGHLTGAATLTLDSDGAGTSNLGITALSPITLAVSADVFNYAQGTVSNDPVMFGNHRVGDVVSEGVPVANTAPTGMFTENLDANISGATGTNTFTPNLSGIVAGTSGTITAGLDTTSAGAKTGSASLALVSDGAGTSGLGLTPRSTVTLSSSGTVYRYAVPGTVAAIHLGTIRVNTPNSTPVTITNSAANDGFSDSLAASYTGMSAGVTTGGGPIVVGPNSSSNLLTITLATANAGHQTGTANVHFQSDGTAEGLGVVPLPTGGDQTVNIDADVVNFAQAAMREDTGTATYTPGTNSATLNFGTIAPGQLVSASLSVLNVAVAPADDLIGTWTLTTAPDFTLQNFNSLTPIAAGSAESDFNVSFSSNSAGTLTEFVTLHPSSHDSVLADATLSDFTLTITANVVSSVPEPASLVLFASLAPLLLRRRRKC